jgi:hypothetical protein
MRLNDDETGILTLVLKCGGGSLVLLVAIRVDSEEVDDSENLHRCAFKRVRPETPGTRDVKRASRIHG